MGIRDLLSVCPRCGRGPLAAARRGGSCGPCGVTYRRGRGDRIVATGTDGSVEERRAAHWLDATPASEIPTSGNLAGPEPVVLRVAEPRSTAVRYDGELIGWVEQFGTRRKGRLILTQLDLAFVGEDGGTRRIQVDDLTSIQPSSSSLQLRTRAGDILSLRFEESSVLHWERALQTAVKRRWSATGRGEVYDYQPRILAR